MIPIIKGDLISLAKTSRFNIIAHGCNCFHIMGGGIARLIKENFPEAYKADKETEFSSYNKLGTYSVGYSEKHRLRILNLYTQYEPGVASPMCEIPLDYNALRLVLRKVNNDFIGHLGIPWIGCGLAGGDQQIVYQIMNEELNNIDATIVEL